MVIQAGIGKPKLRQNASRSGRSTPDGYQEPGVKGKAASSAVRSTRLVTIATPCSGNARGRPDHPAGSGHPPAGNSAGSGAAGRTPVWISQTNWARATRKARLRVSPARAGQGVLMHGSPPG